jgi:hypothetical protein
MRNEEQRLVTGGVARGEKWPVEPQGEGAKKCRAGPKKGPQLQKRTCTASCKSLFFLVETKRFELERMALSQVRTGGHINDKKYFVDNG